MLSGSAVQRSVRVFVAEINRTLADRLNVLSAEYSDLLVVGAVSSGSSAVEAATLASPDVVLVDGRLADPDAVSVCAGIQWHVPGAAVILICEGPADQRLLAAVEAGVCGLMTPAASDDEIVLTILRAADGEFLLPRLLVQRLFRVGRELRREAKSGRECSCDPTRQSGRSPDE